MSPKYKLTYFNAKGAGESIRFLLAYMGEDFEDNRIEQDQWPSYKSKTPYGRMPMLEEEGKPVMTQSMAIARYLGKKAGLGGKDDWENLQIDIIADTIVDVRLVAVAFLFEPNQEIAKEKKETYIKETLPFYFKKLEAVVKENGGYLANKKMSWVDVVFASQVDFFSLAVGVPDVSTDYPNLHALKQKVFAIPKIQKWVEKRPKTHF